MRGGPQVSEEHGADLAYDTPFLPKSAETPLMVMAGFFHLRRCRDKGGVADVAVFPANCAVLEATLAHQEEHPGQHDQFSFNTAIAGLGNAFNYSLLDPLRFANGALFFGARAPQMLGVRAAVVQNNHMTGTANKEHRFREHLLWFLESPAYFRAPEERFLQYDARAPAPAGIVHEASALRNALALARLLNRTLLLPLFCLYHPHPGVYAGSADWRTAEEYFQMGGAAQSAPVKEHSFLLNPQTPPELLAEAEAAPRLFINPFQSDESVHGAPDADRLPPEFAFVPADPSAGATPNEIRRWFGEESVLGKSRVLSFASLHGTRVQVRPKAPLQDAQSLIHSGFDYSS